MIEAGFTALLAPAISALLSALPMAVQAPLIASIGITAASQFLAGALLVGGIVAAAFLMGGKPAAPTINPGRFKSTFEGEETSEINAVGRARLGGVQVFGNTSGSNRFRLIAQCKGPVDLVEETFLGGQEVILAADGDVRSPPWRDNGSFVKIQNKVGDGTETAWPELTTFFPQLWTSDHRVRGIAQALALYISPGFDDERFPKMFQGGEPPLEQVMRVGSMFDPRIITPNVWSQNSIVCALHVLLSWPELSVSDFDLDFLADEADRADVLVNKRDGLGGTTTEPRSRCSGVWMSEQPRGEVMQDLLRSIGAEIIERPNDLLGIRLIDDDPAVDSSSLFSADDIAFLKRPHIARAWFAKLDLPSGLTRLHNGVGTVTADGFDWLGVSDPLYGRLVGISPVEEPAFGQAAAVTLTLTGASKEFIQSVFNDARDIEGRAADIYWAAFDPETQEIWPGGLKRLFPRGRMSAPAIRRVGIGVREASLTIENIFATQNFPPGGRWNSADQRRRFPGDKGLDYVGAKLKETWR